MRKNPSPLCIGHKKLTGLILTIPDLAQGFLPYSARLMALRNQFFKNNH